MKKFIILFLLIFNLINMDILLENNYTINKELLEQSENISPIVIIGSGPAGCSAAIACGGQKIPAVVFAGDLIGGQITRPGIVTNWPGILDTEGSVIMENLIEQANRLNTTFLKETVVSINASVWPYVVLGSNGTEIKALSIIIASGTESKIPRRLNCPGEDTYWGKGISTFKDDNLEDITGTVVVVGGGDSACTTALKLSSNGLKVIMIIRSNKMKASKLMQAKVEEEENIEIIYNSSITSICGDKNKVTHITYAKNEEIFTQEVSNIFLELGHNSNFDLVKNIVELSDDGSLIKCIGNTQKTSRPGIFAAGNIENPYGQCGVAAGNGIKAGVDACNFLYDNNFDAEFLIKYQESFFVY
jgi:thioredoxin reductase (NADPH)